MSGLEKFQDNPAWRQQLLSHLLTDRAPRTAAVKSPRLSMERRHSLDIVLDFPALIKARKAELEQLQKREESRIKSAINIHSDSEVMFKFGEESQDKLQNPDESFDALERMCDKTASDPDSTLFQYLHSDDRDQVLALAKERSVGSSSNKSSDLEMDALRRMLDDVDFGDQLVDESPLKGVECTQLEDIEAPSRLWDNDYTILGNDSLRPNSAKTSPVKMVGLLRPSTILEANEADLTGFELSDASSGNNISFQTADTLKTAASLETIASGSSCYRTAANNSLEEEATALNVDLDVDELFYAAIAKAKPHGMSKGEEEELLTDLHETLIDLVAQKQNETMENTIIELSSSDEEEETENNAKVAIKLEQTLANDSSIEEENKENKEEKSIHFNDTMEEMEYMMQKGLEYMAAKAANKVPTNPNTPTKQPLNAANSNSNLFKQNTFTLSPKKIASPVHPVSHKKITPSRVEINMNRPMEKFFKQPSAIPMRRNIRELKQKDQFAHIVSPIRTYTQKSSTAPLMSMFRQTHNLKDAFNQLSLLELEQESRLCDLKRGQGAGSFNPKKLSADCINPKASLLPKKAYISSELKQFVDERTPMPMPNVPKIQKYLNTAVEATVLRHDGKKKIGPEQSGRSGVSQIPRRPNQSLADLSLASGDISLYTIKDAQKF